MNSVIDILESKIRQAEEYAASLVLEAGKLEAEAAASRKTAADRRRLQAAKALLERNAPPGALA